MSNHSPKNRARLERAFGLIALCACSGLMLTAPVSAQSQTWVVDERTSLAWWQMNPHIDHLWATTCPGDPSWQPGDGHSGGWSIDRDRLPDGHKGSSSALSPSEHIPLFPREEVREVCTPAVAGEIVVGDASTWDGVEGRVAVDVNGLETGSNLRNRFTVGLFAAHSEIAFRVDRLENVQRGDTLRATAVGILELRGVETPMEVPIKAWREADGLRVVGKFQVPARDLIRVYGMSRWKLGLGATSIWKELHMGIDVVLRRAAG
jgi:hypothetical protein